MLDGIEVVQCRIIQTDVHNTIHSPVDPKVSLCNQGFSLIFPADYLHQQQTIVLACVLKDA